MNKKPKNVKQLTVKQLFTSARRWIQGGYSSENKSGTKMLPDISPNHKCFCLAGGVRKIYPTHRWDEIFYKLNLAIKKFDNPSENPSENLYDLYAGECGVIIWNDKSDRKFKDVQTVIKMANV